jgi:hypothetical protein
MKSFVREQGPTLAVVILATLAITSLAGGGKAGFYVAFCVSMAAGLWWEARKGRLG